MERTPETAFAFFKLPQEMRDKIYDYAFGSQFAVSMVIAKTDWRAKENEKRDKLRWDLEWARVSRSGPMNSEEESLYNYKVKPFPGNPLHPMILSKQFFNEAVKTWFRHATLQFPTHDALEKFLQSLEITPIDAITSVRVRWTGSKHMHGVFVPNIRWCTGLRRLQVTVIDGLEDLLEEKHDFQDDLEEADFKHLQIVRDISALTSLTKLELVPGSNSHARSAEEIAQYAKNLLTMQRYIESVISSGGGDKASPCSKAEAFEIRYMTTRPIGERRKWVYNKSAIGEYDEAVAFVCRQMRWNEQDQTPASKALDGLNSTARLAFTSVNGGITRSNKHREEEFLNRGDSQPPSSRALISDVGRTRVAKSSSPRRESNDMPSIRRTPSGKDLAFGGVLFANTVCSVLALYFATRR